jgi:hypothetical protein
MHKIFLLLLTIVLTNQTTYADKTKKPPLERQKASWNLKRSQPRKLTGLPPHYLGVFEQSKKVTESSSTEEIKAALKALEELKKSDEVKCFVKDNAPSAYRDMEIGPETFNLIYDELAEEAETISRGSYSIINLPAKIENEIARLTKLLPEESSKKLLEAPPLVPTEKSPFIPTAE